MEPVQYLIATHGNLSVIPCLPMPRSAVKEWSHYTSIRFGAYETIVECSESLDEKSFERIALAVDRAAYPENYKELDDAT